MRHTTTSNLSALLSLLLPSLVFAGSDVDPNAVMRSYYGALRNFDPHSDYVPPANRHRRRGVCSSKGSVKTTKKGGTVYVTAGSTTKTTTTALTSNTATTTSTAVVTTKANAGGGGGATTAAPTSTPTGTSGSTKRGTVGAYFPDWNLDVMTPAQIDYSKYDWIQFSFAIPDKNFNLEFTQDDSITTLKSLVKYGHAANTLIAVSIGGWTGSKYFSSAVSTPANRQKFVANIATLVSTYGIDGIDIDWEYPGRSGNAGNIVSASDSANMLAFFQLLRSTLGNNKRLTAAVTDFTFTGSNGQGMTDVSAFGKVMDGVLVMNYDTWGSSANPGSNAPFSTSGCATTQPGVSMVDAIKTWTSAGFPANKIIMGLAAYGYINWSTKTSLVHRRRSESPRSLSPPSLAELLGHHKRSEGGAMTRFERYAVDAERRRMVRANDENAHLGHLLHKRQSVNSCPNPNVNCQTTGNPLNPSNLTNAGGAGSIKAATNGDLSTYPDTQIAFSDLVKWGVITPSSSSQSGFTGANGYTYAWDSCSSTPFAYNQLRKTVVTFDDPRSILQKAQYALTSGIQGVGFWEMTQDYKKILTINARNGVGES